MPGLLRSFRGASALAFLALQLPVSSALSQRTIAIRHVTVIDGTGAAARGSMTVIVTGDRIVASGPDAQVKVPRGAMEIDATGKFLLPGFIDTHAHVAMGPVKLETKNGAPSMSMAYDHAASRELMSTLLAFGVTAVRNPAGPTREAVALRDSVARGSIPGPRIVTAGDILDLTETPGLGIRTATEEAVRAEVDRQAAAGVDFVKLYASLSPPLVRAGIDQAHKRGVKVVAHLLFTSWTDAANAGIDAITHVVPGSPLLLPASQRKDYIGGIKGTQFMYSWFKYVDLAPPEIEAMVKAILTHKVILDPTLVTFEAMFRGTDSAITKGEQLRFAPNVFRSNWENDFTLSQGWTSAEYADAAAQWPTVQRFVKLLYDRGVHLTVGTDTPNPWVAPGTSFHGELELMAGAGIPTRDLLRMATLGGAESMGREGEIGSIAVGKRADLVLLDADPLADITNTRRIARVVVGGRVFLPNELLPARLQAGATPGARPASPAVRPASEVREPPV